MRGLDEKPFAGQSARNRTFKGRADGKGANIVTQRQRILMGLTALLYLGPLLAGLAGQSWIMVMAFVAVFLLWLAVLRPGHWPRGRDEWKQPDRQISVVTQSLVQVLLVIVLFVIGRGLGGILGVLPLFHPLMPLAVSFVALPFSRLATGIPVPSMTPDDAANPRLQAAVRVTETLNGLPHGVDHAVIDAHMRAISGQIGAEDLRRALLARVAGGEASTATMRALNNLGSNSTWAKSLDEAAAEKVFAAISQNATLAMHFATTMNANVSADPDMAFHCPSAASLFARADVLKGTEAEVPLRSLAARVARMTQAPEDTTEPPPV
jgi:hypothetical protein